MGIKSTKLKKFAKNCKSGQYTKYFKQRFRDQARKFLHDLNQGILANSPSYPDHPATTPAATNSYINHTTIQADSKATFKQAKAPLVPFMIHTGSGVQMGKAPQRLPIPEYIVGFHDVLSLFNRWDTIPDRLYIWNRSATRSKNKEYAINVQQIGWKYMPPYKPLQSGWLFAKQRLKSRSSVWYNRVFSKLVKVNEE